MEIDYTFEAAMRKVSTAVAMKHQHPRIRNYAVRKKQDIDNKYELLMDKKPVAEIYEEKGNPKRVIVKMMSIDGFAQRMAEFVGDKLEGLGFTVKVNVPK